MCSSQLSTGFVNFPDTSMCQALCGQGQMAVDRRVHGTGDTEQVIARSCLQEKDSLNIPSWAQQNEIVAFGV